MGGAVGPWGRGVCLSLPLNRSGAGLGVSWLGWCPWDLGLQRAPPSQEGTGLSSRGAQGAGRGTPGRGGDCPRLRLRVVLASVSSPPSHRHRSDAELAFLAWISAKGSQQPHLPSAPSPPKCPPSSSHSSPAEPCGGPHSPHCSESCGWHSGPPLPGAADNSCHLCPATISILVRAVSLPRPLEKLPLPTSGACGTDGHHAAQPRDSGSDTPCILQTSGHSDWFSDGPRGFPETCWEFGKEAISFHRGCYAGRVTRGHYTARASLRTTPTQRKAKLRDLIASSGPLKPAMPEAIMNSKLLALQPKIPLFVFFIP